MDWEKFYSHTIFEIGDGIKVRFWHDLQCGDRALKEAFLCLYGIAYTNDASVVALLELFDGSTQWNVIFARTAHDQDLGGGCLCVVLQNIILFCQSETGR